MATINDLKIWIKEDLRYANDENIELVKENYFPELEEIKIKLYTETNCYSITGCIEKMGKFGFKKQPDKTYLSCIATSRKPRAGENCNRGNDLADGPFNKETWIKIFTDIVGYELVKVHKPKEGLKYNPSTGEIYNPEILFKNATKS